MKNSKLFLRAWEWFLQDLLRVTTALENGNLTNGWGVPLKFLSSLPGGSWNIKCSLIITIGCYIISVSSVQFSRSVMSDSLWPHVSQHARPPCPSPTPGVHSNSRPSSRWSHPAISSSVIPFSSCPQSFPATGPFPMSQLFPSGSQSIGAWASASVLPMSIQGWFPLRLIGLISLLSKGLSRVFSSITVRKHRFFGTQPTLWSNYLYITTGKNHSFDYTDLCQQDNVSAF